MSRRLVLATAVLLGGGAAFLGCGPDPGSAERGPSGAPQVRTAAGLLEGIRVPIDGAGSGGTAATAPERIEAFLGVPYAEAPVDERRWRPPSRPGPWDGVRAARSLAPACPQPPFAVEFARRVARRLGGDPEAVPEIGPRSEDCLYLNVWTPTSGADARLPVFVWVHGGAGTVGSAGEPVYDGRRLAARGAVVVTVAYRLGPLGFLAHPALSRESARGVSGNYALLDLIEALRWVRREIRAFGGDPERVTLAGQSAGAALAVHLMASPLADGLFQRAVLHSGTGIEIDRPLRAGMPGLHGSGEGGTRSGPGEDAGADSPADGAETGEALGRRLARALGIEDGAAAAAALRAMPADSLISTALAAGAMPDRPVVDGWVVTESAGSALARGRLAEVPVLLGSTSLEAAVLVPPPPSVEAYREGVRERFGPDAPRVLALYPASDSASAARARRTLVTDEWFGAPIRLAARRLAESGRAAWLYRFDRAYPARRGEEVGSFHGVELPYLFGHFLPAWGAPAPADRAFSDLVAGIWLRFAAAGDPNAAGLPRWPVFDPGRPRALFLGAEPEVGRLPRPAALDLFEERLLPELPFPRR